MKPKLLGKILKRSPICLSLLLIVCNLSHLAFAEEFKLNSYFPTPYGTFNTFNLLPQNDLAVPCQTGTVYVNALNVPQYCDLSQTWSNFPSVWSQNGDDIFLSDTALFPDVHVGINIENVPDLDDSVSLHLVDGLNFDTTANVNYSFGGQLVLAAPNASLVMVAEDAPGLASSILLTETTDISGLYQNTWSINRNGTTSDFGTFSIAYSDTVNSEFWEIKNRILMIEPDGKTALGAFDQNAGDPSRPLSELHIQSDDTSVAIRLEEETTADGKTVFEFQSQDDNKFHIYGGESPDGTCLDAGATCKTRMTILPDGKIGLNTENPSSQLELGGDGSILLQNEVFGDVGIAFIDQDPGFKDYNIRKLDGLLAIEEAPISHFSFSWPPAFILRDDGNIGMGLQVPETYLHIQTEFGLHTDVNYSNADGFIFQSHDSMLQIIGENADTTMSHIVLSSTPNSPAQDSKHWIISHFGPDRNHDFAIHYKRANGAFDVTTADPEYLVLQANGNVGIGRRNPAHLLELKNPSNPALPGAHCTGTTFVNVSSRESKNNIYPLSEQEAFAVIKDIEPVQFYYKVDPDDPRIGFIAEDVPELVASEDRKTLTPMDITAVLTKVMQQHEHTIGQQNNALEKQAEDIDRLLNDLKKWNEGL